MMCLLVKVSLRDEGVHPGVILLSMRADGRDACFVWRTGNTLSGGKYVGFGSSGSPASSEPNHPSFAMSSHNAPSLQEFQSDPISALSKGWGLFSSAVVAAGSTINESVIQPGMKQAGQTVGEINERGFGHLVDGGGVSTGSGGGGAGAGSTATSRLADQAKMTTGWLTSVAGEGWAKANQLAKERAGVDLDFTDRLGHLKGDGPSRYQGYGQVGGAAGTSSSAGGDDGWGEWDGGNDNHATSGGFRDDGEEDVYGQSKSSAGVVGTNKQGSKPEQDEKWDDDWKAF